MESRMEKYYKDNSEYYQRSKRNEDLYRNIYNDMNDLENLPIPDNSNEIDMNGLKKIISSRDEYRRSKEIEKTFIKNNPITSRDNRDSEDKRVYDINVLLENAKNEVNKSNELEGRKIINANFLTDLEDANIPDVEIEKDYDKDKRLSNTDSLPLDILVDLKGSDNTIVTDPILKDEVTMIKNIKDGETFYSGSFNFTKKDFADDDFFDEKPHNGVKIFFLILGFILLGFVIFIAIKKYVI